MRNNKKYFNEIPEEKKNFSILGNTDDLRKNITKLRNHVEELKKLTKENKSITMRREGIVDQIRCPFCNKILKIFKKEECGEVVPIVKIGEVFRCPECNFGILINNIEKKYTIDMSYGYYGKDY